MALTIEAPEVEEKLQQAAAKRGMNLEEYLLQLVVSSLSNLDQIKNPSHKTTPKRPLFETASPAELNAALDRWSARHTDTLLISDEALRRENLYEDRGI